MRVEAKTDPSIEVAARVRGRWSPGTNYWFNVLRKIQRIEGQIEFGGSDLGQTRVTVFSGGERIGGTICKEVLFFCFLLGFHVSSNATSCERKNADGKERRKEVKIRIGGWEGRKKRVWVKEGRKNGECEDVGNPISTAGGSLRHHQADLGTLGGALGRKRFSDKPV